MAQVPLKLNDVMRTHAQLMEDSAIGMNGQHALLNAEVETKQELDDATALYQNLVVWNARVDWDEWTACTAECGGGDQTRARR